MAAMGDAIALARGADIDLRRRPASARPAGAGARLAGARPAGTRSSRFGEAGDLGHRGVDRAGDAIALALGADLDLSAEARPRPVTRCRQIKASRFGEVGETGVGTTTTTTTLTQTGAAHGVACPTNHRQPDPVFSAAGRGATSARRTTQQMLLQQVEEQRRTRDKLLQSSGRDGVNVSSRPSSAPVSH